MRHRHRSFKKTRSGFPKRGRSKLKRSHSRKNFKKHSSFHKKNSSRPVMRGGIRL